MAHAGGHVDIRDPEGLSTLNKSSAIASHSLAPTPVPSFTPNYKCAE